MSATMNLGRQQRIALAGTIIENMPDPDYATNFQLPYHGHELLEAVAENLSTHGVAEPQAIDALSADIAAVGEGASDRPIIISNSCAEEISVDQPIDELAQKTLDEIDIIARSRLADPIIIQRICGQFVKPRSKMKEGSVYSYMGDGINGRDLADRFPDASRLVAGALQSRDLQEYLTGHYGDPVLTAHETLSLPYEIPFVRLDAYTGKRYLYSAHLPWIGLRTNGLDSVHLDLLSGVQNTVGVKIGANSDERHIAGLASTLNPEDLPGKIAFMIRIGEQDEARLLPILSAIRKHAPEAAVMYDIHGATKTDDNGNKIRLRDDIVGSVERLAYACGSVGLRLNGLHLETMNIQGRFECVNNMRQKPVEGSVDPRLNPKQTKLILDRTVQFINQ